MGNRNDLNGHVLVGWKLVYGDFSVVRSTDMSFLDAPQHNVQALIRYYQRPRGGYSSEILTGQDLYTLTREEVLQMSFPNTIKVGSFLTDEQYDSIMKEVYSDTEIITGM